MGVIVILSCLPLAIFLLENLNFLCMFIGDNWV